MNKIISNYEYYTNTPSDIHEHLPTLKRYAEECNHVTEMGVRFVVSTWALLAAKPKRMVAIDIVQRPIGEVSRLAEEAGIEFQFQLGDTADENFQIEETDLLFIDTWHIYDQLKREFQLHSNKARKYIILHDTTKYGDVGEEHTYENALIKVGEQRTGLWPAIEEFIEDHPEWYIKERYTNNNGLTVLARK
jgi:hypothetical protein